MDQEESSEEICQQTFESQKRPLVVFPRRYLIALLSFFGFANIYALRVNLSVAIVAMTSNRTISTGNGTDIVVKPEFDWDKGIQGIILSSFFYGYILTQIIGGWLACKYGGKLLFLMGVAITAFFTLLTPFLARISVYLLVIARVVEGLFEGVTFPAMHGLWSKWSPPEERSRMVAISYSGCYFGTVAALPLCGALADRLGWSSIFYVLGAVGLFWCFFWLYFVKDSPSHDSEISIKEKEYIEHSLGITARSKVDIPWQCILLSPPVWAIVIAHFCENWGFYTLLTELPSYMNDVFEFNMERSGYLEALPYLVMGIVVQSSGFMADWLRGGHLSTMQVRKLFTCCGFITRALFLLAAAHASTPVAILASLTVAVGFGGLSFGGFSVNHLDIAPQFASILMGISNTFATLPGILSPILTSHIVKNKSTVEWQTVFHISAVIYMLGALVYAFLASGKVQSWALVGQEQVFLSDNEHSQTSTEDLLPTAPPRYQSVR